MCDIEEIPSGQDLEREILMRETVKMLLNILDHRFPKHKKAIELYYGLNDGQYMTLEEVGIIMDLSKERIRIMISSGFRHIRNRIRTYEIDFDSLFIPPRPKPGGI